MVLQIDTCDKPVDNADSFAVNDSKTINNDGKSYEI